MVVDVDPQAATSRSRQVRPQVAILNGTEELVVLDSAESDFEAEPGLRQTSVDPNQHQEKRHDPKPRGRSEGKGIIAGSDQPVGDSAHLSEVLMPLRRVPTVQDGETTDQVTADGAFDMLNAKLLDFTAPNDHEWIGLNFENLDAPEAHGPLDGQTSSEAHGPPDGQTSVAATSSTSTSDRHVSGSRVAELRRAFEGGQLGCENEDEYSKNWRSPPDLDHEAMIAYGASWRSRRRARRKPYKKLKFDQCRVHNCKQNHNIDEDDDEFEREGPDLVD